MQTLRKSARVSQNRSTALLVEICLETMYEACIIDTAAKRYHGSGTMAQVPWLRYHGSGTARIINRFVQAYLYRHICTRILLIYKAMLLKYNIIPAA